MRYSTLYKIPIKIVTIFLLLSSLHPGNYLHGQKQPDTLSFYLPNILVTAIESKTPGTVSLLPASTLEHTQPITISDLTQLFWGDRRTIFLSAGGFFKERGKPIS